MCGYPDHQIAFNVLRSLYLSSSLEVFHPVQTSQAEREDYQVCDVMRWLRAMARFAWLATCVITMSRMFSGTPLRSVS